MLTSSHDLHLLRIDVREDALVRNSSEWVTAIIDDMHDRVEMKRNRERITEIFHFVESQREAVDEIEDQVVIQPVYSEEFIDPDASNIHVDIADIEAARASQAAEP